MIAHEHLMTMLTRLHLTAIRDQLDSLLDEAARQELTLRETLAFLCQREIARKDERRIQMGTRIAHFPCIATLAGFDYAAQPSVDERQIRELAACRWVAHGENLLLLGPPGVGKTHLAIALGREAILSGSSWCRGAMSAAASSSPATAPYPNGAWSLATRSPPPPSSTACCTTATSSPSAVIATASKTSVAPGQCSTSPWPHQPVINPRRGVSS